MPKNLTVVSSLNSTPPAFIKSLSRVSRSTSMARSGKTKRGRKKKGFFTIEMSPSLQYVEVAFTELELALLSMAHNGIKRIAGVAFRRIKKRSGPIGGIKSESLMKSWRMRLYRRVELKTMIHTPGKKAVYGSAGTMLFGYGIYTNNQKFLKPINTRSSGTTDLLEILEYGSRPHKIRPKNGSRLKFFWEKSDVRRPIVGTKTFLGLPGQSVNHPGTKPYGFTRITVAEAAGSMLGLHLKMKHAKFLVGK